MEQAFDLTVGLKIRKAATDDAIALRSYCFPSETLEEMEKQLKQDIERMEKGEMFRLVAEIDDYAVGDIQIEFGKGKSKKIAQIKKLIVTGPFRGSNVADRLVDASFEMAKQAGVNIVQIEASRSNGKIIEKYKSWGFEEKETIILERKL